MSLNQSLESQSQPSPGAGRAGRACSFECGDAASRGEVKCRLHVADVKYADAHKDKVQGPTVTF